MAGAPYAHGETVTRLTGAPVSDPYGGPGATVLDYSTPTALDVEGVGVEPMLSGSGSTQSRNAAGEARQLVEGGYVLYWPTDVPVGPEHRVRVRGRDCRVVGVPADWRSPLTGWHPGVVVTVEFVTG